VHARARVARDERVTAPARLEPAPRVQVDRDVDRLGTAVEEVQRPEVDCSAGQVDACRS
jgi:hypothetical protein